jgi:hypothetical protein
MTSMWRKHPGRSLRIIVANIIKFSFIIKACKHLAKGRLIFAPIRAHCALDVSDENITLATCSPRIIFITYIIYLAIVSRQLLLNIRRFAWIWSTHIASKVRLSIATKRNFIISEYLNSNQVSLCSALYRKLATLREPHAVKGTVNYNNNINKLMTDIILRWICCFCKLYYSLVIC